MLRSRLHACLAAGVLAGATASFTARAEVPRPKPASAAPALPDAAIGFSNLVLRIDGKDEIGLGAADLRVHMLEHMRNAGWRAVGAESLVFEKDESRRADFRVGGTIREVSCLERRGGASCRIGVDWELLDVESDAVVYKARTRFAALDVPTAQRDRLAIRLLTGALDSLLSRSAFRGAIAARGATPSEEADTAFPRASFGKCAMGARKMPDAAEDVLAATVLVQSGKGFGSGFFLTQDGLLVTAAHVVGEPSLKVRLRDGAEVDAVAIRVAKRADVALLRTVRPTSGQRCLPTAPIDASVGGEVYASGAPADMKLAFSLTRGIVSGVRTIDGRRQIQTDAAVSPGNSGGPLLDGSASAAGVVTSKLAGGKVEGVAFAVPIRDALVALGLDVGNATDPVLLAAAAAQTVARAPVDVAPDDPDPVPSLDPAADRAAAERRDLEAREKTRAAATPGYVRALYWGGLAAGVVGTGLIVYSRTEYDDKQTTHGEYDRLKLENAIGWGLAGVGAAAFVTSFVLRPSLPPRASPSTALTVGPGQVRWEGTF